MKSARTNTFSVVLVLLAAGAFVALVGCESESVAPNDNLPAISPESAAQIAGYVAFYLNEAYGVYQDAFSKAESGEQSFSAGGVSGGYTLEFRCDGSPCESGDADFLRGYTAAGQQIEVRANLSDDLPLVVCTFDAQADDFDGTVGSESGTVFGHGALVAGEYESSFTVEGVFLSLAEYPPGGSLTYLAGDNAVEVTFNGTRYANLVVGETHYLVDLDDGSVDEVTP
jgi:hypothetical protein